MIGDGGENKKSLQRRLAAILGQDSVKDTVSKLYDFRSQAVHGTTAYLNKGVKGVYHGHLREARKLARRSLVWALRYLGHVHHETPRLGHIPDREQLLKALDLAVPQNLRVRDLLDRLPATFPAVSEWRGDDE